jgi:hypothetical protein
MVSWYRERIDKIIDEQTVGWTVADKRRLRERFVELRHATLTERNAFMAGRVRVGTSSAPIRSVNVAARVVRCPKCGAGPGRPCETPSGYVRHPHLARRKESATLDETRELTSPRVSSSAAPTSPPSPRSTPDPLLGANCELRDATADNFHVPDGLWERVGLGHVQACFKCFRIAAWNAGVRPTTAWEVSLG